MQSKNKIRGKINTTNIYTTAHFPGLVQVRSCYVKLVLWVQAILKATRFSN